MDGADASKRVGRHGTVGFWMAEWVWCESYAGVGGGGVFLLMCLYGQCASGCFKVGVIGAF